MTVVDSLTKRAHLLGHSFGVLCALEAALRTPNLRTLVLYEPVFPLPSVVLYPPVCSTGCRRCWMRTIGVARPHSPL
jgi:pimeloyl-ACP methyl ester carboxylesterase